MITTSNGVDWAALLLQTLLESPLLHLDLHHTPCLRSKQLNPWQCHVLLSFLSSLVPRIKAEIVDWKLCCSSSSSSSRRDRAYRDRNPASSAGGTELGRDGIEPGDDGDDAVEDDRRRLRELAQIALREMLTSIRKAENYFVCHTVARRDGGPEPELELLLMAASSCDGEALCVHLHNIFWCFAGFMAIARRSLGFPDTTISGLMEEQIRCWHDLVSRYFCLGAQTLDLRHLQFLAQTEDLSYSSSSPMERLLRRRLDLILLLARSEAKLLEDDSILDLIKIDFKDLEGIKKRKLCGSNSDDGGDGGDDESDHNSVVEARIGGVRVSLWGFASILALKRRAKSRLRSMRSPFMLQLLGWSAESESHGSCTTCYLVMEAIESNLKSSIASALSMPTTRKASAHGEGEFPTGFDPHQHQLVSPFPFYIALDMMLQIARGMWYLHHNRIAHGNLRSSTVWMTDPSKPSHRQKFYDILLSDEGGPGLHTRIKLCSISGSRDDDSIDLLHSSKFNEDVASFGHLCIEILTGKRRARIAADKSSISNGLMSGSHGDGDVISDDLMLPQHVPDALIECVKACCHHDPGNRPDFSAICGLLRRLKLVAYLTPLDRDLKLDALVAMNRHINKGTITATDDESVYANVEDLQVISSYNTFALNLLEVNVKLLYTSTPAEMYAHVAWEALSTTYNRLEDRDENSAPRMSVSMRELTEMSIKLGGAMMQKELKKENGPNTQRRKHVKVITSKASTLETALVEDGCRGLLRIGWINTTMGLGTLEMWLNTGYMAKLEWKQVAKLGLGIALCVRYASKPSVSQKMGSYSSKQGHCIDGFYPICPASILLNPQLRAALLLDDNVDAWDGLVQWAGVHPHLSKQGSISIDAYATFYYGHLLEYIIRARQSQPGESNPVLSSSEQRFASALVDLARRCTQLECPSMSEVVDVLLDCECQNSSKASSPNIESAQALE